MAYSKEFIVSIAKKTIDPMILLLKDYERAEIEVKNLKDDYCKRNYFRVVFSYIEGAIFLMKQVCYAISVEDKTIEIQDYGLLRDVSYDLNNNGVAQEQTKFIRLEDNFKYLVLASNRILSTNFELELGSKEWHLFRQSIKVRNRITHPKIISDLSITDNEVMEFSTSTEWFNDYIIEMMDLVSGNKWGLTKVRDEWITQT